MESDNYKKTMKLKFLLRGLEPEFKWSQMSLYPWILKEPDDSIDTLINFSNCPADEFTIYWVNYKLKKL